MTQHDRAEIRAFVKNDTRTKAEIFQSMKVRIQKRSLKKLSDEEAIAATRRLIAVFDLFVDKPQAGGANIDRNADKA